ncbi:MAG: oligoendopeptidase F [Spirochaetales bacterium]|nr:oligoendopeptidase F [Spirochaetales bacterium]
MPQVRPRSEVPAGDRWNLSLLYADDAAWESDFSKLKELVKGIPAWEGQISSPQALKKAVDFSHQWERLAEKLGEYAHLKVTEDVVDTAANERMGRFYAVVTEANAASSYLIPEILAIADEQWNTWIQEEYLAEDRLSLAKLRRFKAHVLGEEAERVLALGGEVRGSASKTFSQLTNADMNFGTLTVDGQDLPLSQSSYSVFLQNPDRQVRQAAYKQFYAEFGAHANTLASLFAASVQQDVWMSRARGYASSRSQALYADDVPESVYDNLIQTVRASLPLLHRYYEIRRRALGVERLHHSDAYAPMVPEARRVTRYEEAVELVEKAVSPLGSEYQAILKQGLTGGWVDKYENKGKRSGAFSAGCYDSVPYILLNYKEEDLRDVFTLAHEAGHSLHSWFSKKHNPYQHYGYTIFEAEVASTFNEQLLAKVFLDQASEEKEKAAVLGKLVEDTVATLFRQTMFAEFEHLVHQHAEEGGALTLEYFRSTYRGLLGAYFGSAVELPEEASLEGLRIPHFYNAFYVYKYATGLSAAIALSDRVLKGGEKEREQYLGFLKSGGSRFPLESLKEAGVDMSQPEPIQRAMEVFGRRLDELERLLFS